MVAFTLCAPAARVRITAPEIFSERKNSLSDAAVLINSDSAVLRAKSEQCKKASYSWSNPSSSGERSTAKKDSKDLPSKLRPVTKNAATLESTMTKSQKEVLVIAWVRFADERPADSTKNQPWRLVPRRNLSKRVCCPSWGGGYLHLWVDKTE